MQQGIHVNGWRLNVKEKTVQVIVSVLIIVLSIYIASKCINTIVKDKAKGNINEAAVQTANFLVGEIIENTSILTQYMIYMENHGDLSEEMKKQILESVVTEYINGSEYSYDTNDPGYKQVVQLIYDKVNATEQPETTQLETVEETTTQPQTKVEEAKKELVPIPKMTGTKYTKDNLGSFKKVIERFYTVTAATTIRESDMPLDKALSEKFKIKGNNKKPQILIYHTHSMETFSNSNSEDKNTTIIGVGNRLEKVLSKQFGYNVIHDKTTYDIVNGVLDRNEAYTQSEKGVKKILKDNPSISLVLDIHRDGVNDNTHLVTEINGKPTAKIMFLNGMSRFKESGDISYLHNDYLFENLALTLQMKLAAEAYYPDFTRRNYINAYEYNLGVCRQCMLIEIGAQTNTYQEAVNAAEPLAVLIDKVMRGE